MALRILSPSVLIVCAAAVIATGYAAFQSGGGSPPDWSGSLLVLGLAAVVCVVLDSAIDINSPLERGALWAALLFPVYVAFQLLPLPLFLLRILSPTRAALADALQGVMSAPRFAPLSISPAQTWTHLARIVGYSLVFLLVWKAARHSTRSAWALAAPLLAIASLEAVLGLSQLSKSSGGGIQAISGTYLNKDHFAGLLEIVLPFVLLYGATVLYRSQKQGGSAPWALLQASGVFGLAAAMFAAIMFSLSKMGFIALLGSLFVMAVVWLWVGLSGRKKWIVLAALAGLILFVFVFAPPQELVKGYGGASSDPTAEGRWPIAKDTLHLIAAYPLFGCGLGDYYTGFLRYQTWGLNVAWVNAHNDYLEFLSELGILGFLIPAVLIGAVATSSVRAALWSTNREVRLLGLACTGSLAAMLIHSFGDFNLYVPANALALSWVAGIGASLPVGMRKDQPGHSILTAALLRKFLFALGVLASLYAGGLFIFWHSFRTDARAERVFCRYGMCDTREAGERLQREHGNDVSLVPPADLVELLRREPAATYRWSDLAESLQKAGRTAEARYSLAQAVALGPHIPYTLFRAANFHLNLGENRDAIDLIAPIAEGGPDYERAVFFALQQKRIPTHEILSHGLVGRKMYQDYLRYLILRRKPTDAEKVWQATVSHGYSDDPLANEYVQSLLQNGKSEAAAQAWALYAGSRDKTYPESNRLFNGDFESEPSGSPFDWPITPTPGAKIDFDHEIVHSGARSLRIQFDGKQNLSSIGIHQTAFLKPGRYRLQAFVRSKEISTDEGVVFQVASQQASIHLIFTTEPILGSADWKLVQHAFVMPTAGLIDVRLVRTPSLRFDSLIRGTLWIDQVSISPQIERP